jgi:superfamily II DNA/RNA helicase
MKFTELNLSSELLTALDYMGFENATPIQEKAIPSILENKDMIACAQTGTGKTAAFILPILNKLVGRTESHVNTLIIVPTRELAMQIDKEIQGLSYFVSVGSMAIYGGGDGSNFNDQKDALQNGRDIIVATPGKLISHLNLGYVNFKHVEHLILDEADKMLDMGFSEDINKIIGYLPKKRQNLMFSATMPSKIKDMARKLLHDPVEIILSISKPAKGIKQQVYLTFDNQKEALLKHVLNERKHYESIILFTSAKDKVSSITRYLNRAGFKAKGISSNLSQDEREEVLRQFRSRRVPILVATDVMSRGIDIKEINMVINYDAPMDAEDYVHRIGRTARANTKGEAVTFVNPKDMVRLDKIQKLIEMEIPRLIMPEELGEGPEWNPKGARSGGGKPFHKNGNGGKSSGGGYKGKKPFKPRTEKKD